MTVSLPGPTLGVVGGGQLGRMLGEAAAPLGVEVVVSDPTLDCPAAPVVSDHVLGEFDDPDTIRELASRVDVLTFEIELADPDVLVEVSEEYDVPVHPDPDTLHTIQDKLVQTETLADAGIPVPEFVGVNTAAALESAVDDMGSVMLKAREGGYDGRGTLPVQPGDDPDAALEEIGGNAMAERLVDFERELSVIGVVGADEIRTYPVTETIHRDEILRESVSPARAPDPVRKRAQAVARDVLELLEGRGTYGIELFETTAGEILVNEIAPRPHNSGHWTIEGAQASQFENHVRGILGWPLGSTDLVAPAVTANVLGDVDERTTATLRGVESVLDEDTATMHWYGKHEVYPLRKMGHLTFTGSAVDPGELLAHARALRDSLTFTAE